MVFDRRATKHPAKIRTTLRRTELRKYWMVLISVQLLYTVPPSLLGSKQGFNDRLDLFHFVEAKKYACNFAFAV